MSTNSSLKRFHIPPYDKNAVIQLIVISGIGFIAVHLVWITLIVYAVPEARSFELTFRYIGMGNLEAIKEKWWTILTYGWCHHGFWEWLSNMLWLYAFGNVVQNLVGYKQIIPLFLYSLLLGGIAFFAVQFLPSMALGDSTLLLGAQAGIMGLMIGGLTLSPKYRIFLSDYFSFPLWALGLFFVFLMLLNNQFESTKIIMLLAGGLSGFVYIKLLQNGYQPGSWVYGFYNRLNNKLTPSDMPKIVKIKTSREEQVDTILDKINEKGFDALSQAEKDLLRETNR